MIPLLEVVIGPGADRWLGVFILVLLRTLPLAFLAPWLGWRGTAAVARAATALVLALAFTPLALRAAPALPPDALAWVGAAVREVALGVSFAIATSLPLYALGWSGALLDRMRGDARPDERALQTLHLGASVVVFLALGGHRLALAAFGRGFVRAPLGAAFTEPTLEAFVFGAAVLVTQSLELAIAFAAPALLVFVVIELALAFGARAGASAASRALALPARAGLGVALALGSLAYFLPRLGPIFRGSVDAASELISGL